jgi:hypothetical protein
MTANSISPATGRDVDQLADMYAKQFRATGFSKRAEIKSRGELVEWVAQLCREDKLWTIRDGFGPITLGHYEPDLQEIKTVVTRDGMEGKGYGTRMLCYLAMAYPLAKVVPVTSSGRALARKCGFSPKQDDESTWIRSTAVSRP